MRGKLLTVHCLLITFLLLSCTPTPEPSLETALLVYRFEPSAFVEYSADLQPVREIPFSIPPSCGLHNTYSAPVGKFLAVELNCPGGQTVLFLDASSTLSASSASVTQLVTDLDSHFLAWTGDGKAAYLKIDSLGSPEIIRVYTDGARDPLAINEFTYDLSAQPDSYDFTFTFSRGMGYGSEIYLAKHDGRITQLLYKDQYNYLSYARWSSNGQKIAFIKTPDTSVPFTVGELWVMDADGSSSHKLTDVDAGHGFAANWSPDGKRIAFVMRENPEDESANQNGSALISNIYMIEVESGKIDQLTKFENARVETPHWSSDGNTLAFAVVINGRMEVHIADTATGEIQSLITGSACCPAWMRK